MCAKLGRIGQLKPLDWQHKIYGKKIQLAKGLEFGCCCAESHFGPFGWKEMTSLLTTTCERQKIALKWYNFLIVAKLSGILHAKMWEVTNSSTTDTTLGPCFGI